MGTNATDATPPTCVDRDRFTRDVPNDLVFTIPHPSHAQHRSSYFIAMRSMLHESFVGWHSASSAVDGRSLRISFHMYPCGVEMGRGSARWSLPFSGLGSGLELIVVVEAAVASGPASDAGGGGGRARGRRGRGRGRGRAHRLAPSPCELNIGRGTSYSAQILTNRRSVASTRALSTCLPPLAVDATRARRIWARAGWGASSSSTPRRWTRETASARDEKWTRRGRAIIRSKKRTWDSVMRSAYCKK
jgi:hypothetical protein